MQKYKVHLIDLEDRGEVISRLIIDESQKKIFDLLRQNNILPEWLRVEICPEDTPYLDLT